MNPAEMILKQGNYIIIPRPLTQFMGIEKTTFLLWIVNHYENVKNRTYNRKEFYYDAGIIEKQTGISLYRQNKNIEELVKWGVVKLAGRNRHNRKNLIINYDIFYYIITEVYLNFKEESYKEFKKSLIKNLISKAGSYEIFNKSINKTKVNNTKKKNNTVVSNENNKESFKLIDTKSKTFYDVCTIKLIKKLQQKRLIAVIPNKKKWAIDIKRLYTVDGVSKSKIKKVLIFYLKNIGKPYIPEVNNGISFRNKFDSLYNAMKKSKKQYKEKNIKITKKAKKVAERLSHLNFPKGSESQLLSTIQLSLNNYSKFCKKHNQFKESCLYNKLELSKSKLTSLQRIIRLVDSHLLPDEQFIRQWMENIHNRIANWETWNGNLTNMAFNSDAEEFQMIGRAWTVSYCNNANRWNNYYKLLENK